MLGREHELEAVGPRLEVGLGLLRDVGGVIIQYNEDAGFSTVVLMDLLEQIHQDYSAETRILIVLDNHSAHISKETQAYLKTRPNRFEFVFTPKHGSWLNLVEGFFAKMTKTILRGIRVASKAELKARIMRYLQDLNADPVVFRWRYKLEEESVS